MKNKPGLSFSLPCFLLFLCSHCNCAKHPPSDEEKKLSSPATSSVSAQPPNSPDNTSGNTTDSEESTESDQEEDDIDPATLISPNIIERAQQAGKAYESLARVLSDLQKNTPGLDGKKYDINTPDEKGQTPLHAAISLGDEDILQALLALKADVNKKIDCPTDPNQHGMTPLHLAIAQGKENIVKLLVDTPGIDLNSQNAIGNTPFHMALTAGIDQGDASLVQYLANQKGLDLNIQNKMGDTPGHLVGRAKNGHAFYTLLGHRFDPHIANRKGERPFYTNFEAKGH